MGHWQSFPTLEFYDTAYDYGYEVTDTSWVNVYGFARVMTKYTPSTEQNKGKLVFTFQGDGVNDYEVHYIIEKVPFTPSKATTPTEGLTIKTEPGNYGAGGYTYDYIYIEQPKKFTISGFNPLMWEIVISLTGVFSGMITVDISVNPDLTVSSSSLTKSSKADRIPNIQITFIPEANFQDLASVTFNIEDGKKHGCAEGKYKQLLSSPKNAKGNLVNLAVSVNEGGGVQQIHVFAPLITCYLAGEGDFSTEKIYSINKTVGPVWDEVFLYAMSKFILNRLMNRKFDMDILYRRNTKTFLEQLRKSNYADFVDYFSKNTDKERYFVR